MIFVIFYISIGGERGIRTLDGLLTHTPLAGERLQPLGHLSVAQRITAHAHGVKLQSCLGEREQRKNQQFSGKIISPLQLFTAEISWSRIFQRRKARSRTRTWGETVRSGLGPVRSKLRYMLLVSLDLLREVISPDWRRPRHFPVGCAGRSPRGVPRFLSARSRRCEPGYL